MTCWIVEGSTGEYEDFETWVVCVYYGSNARERARMHAENARAEDLRLSDQLEKKRARWMGRCCAGATPRKARNEFDRHREDGDRRYRTFSCELIICSAI
jgi:hypothetical protein